jgi:hypothetical protein
MHPRPWAPYARPGTIGKNVGAGVPIAMRIARAYAAILGALLCVGSTPALAGPLEDGQAAYDAGDYETAIRLWRPLAKQGDALAQHALGLVYITGHASPNVAAGLREAREWFRKAADQGFVQLTRPSAYPSFGLSGGSEGPRRGGEVDSHGGRPGRCRRPALACRNSATCEAGASGLQSLLR